MSDFRSSDSFNNDNAPQNNGTKIYLTQLYRLRFRPVIEIAYLRSGSPAALVGLQQGDVITVVNGKRVRDISLQEIIQEFEKKPGAKIKLGVVRAGTKFNYRFVLKSLL